MPQDQNEFPHAAANAVGGADNGDAPGVVVVAAGEGQRAGGALPKQYHMLAGRPVLIHCLDHLTAACPEGSPILLVIHRDMFDHARALLDEWGYGTTPLVVGGATRQESVRRGLEALSAAAPRTVLIHDAARPFINAAMIHGLRAAISDTQGAIPALSVADSLKSVSGTTVTGAVNRDGLVRVQTPQGFPFAPLLAAHRAAKGQDFTDDAGVFQAAGYGVRICTGSEAAFKITESRDFQRAEALVQMRLQDIRVGHGHDVHAFGPGDHVILGGVAIPHDRALKGHSDADVALHALTDAVLAALADGDIGQHFPPSDPALAGISSDRFLRFAAERVRARGGMIAHLALVLIAEAPKIGPHNAPMRQRIARIAGLSPDRVSVQATTSEKLGFTGRREGIAANATATVRLPLEAPDGA